MEQNTKVRIPSLGNVKGVVLNHVNLGGPAKYIVAIPRVGTFVFPLNELVAI